MVGVGGSWAFMVWSAGRDSLVEIQEQWSCDDLVAAMVALDIESKMLPSLGKAG